MDFRTQYGERVSPKLKTGYDFHPVEGFQEHRSESVAILLKRYASGDIDVGRPLYSDDVYPFDGYNDSFDVMDQLANSSDGFQAEKHADTSEFSDSGGSEQPLGNAQEPPDKTGNSESSVNAEVGA